MAELNEAESTEDAKKTKDPLNELDDILKSR